jgi:hypothetical protein
MGMDFGAVKTATIPDPNDVKVLANTVEAVIVMQFYCPILSQDVLTALLLVSNVTSVKKSWTMTKS